MDIYLDPDYAELIIQVNKLKKEVAEKIVEKEWLGAYVLPEIRNSYYLKLGVNEAELFLAELNLKKLKRKIVLYEDSLKIDNKIDERSFDKILNKEFENEENQYNLLKENIDYAIDYTHKEKISNEIIEKLNYIYKELVIKLNPLLNFKNTKFENQLYDILYNAYKSADMNKMIGIKIICDEKKINLDLEIDDLDNLLKIKKRYLELLEENKCLILNIRSSEMFSNKSIIENQVLLRRRKDDINEKINKVTSEYTKLIKKLNKLKNI